MTCPKCCCCMGHGAWAVWRWRYKGPSKYCVYDRRQYLSVNRSGPTWTEDECRALRFKSKGLAQAAACLWRHVEPVKLGVAK